MNEWLSKPVFSGVLKLIITQATQIASIDSKVGVFHTVHVFIPNVRQTALLINVRYILGHCKSQYGIQLLAAAFPDNQGSNQPDLPAIYYTERNSHHNRTLVLAYFILDPLNQAPAEIKDH